jgi:hypothetical protein
MAVADHLLRYRMMTEAELVTENARLSALNSGFASQNLGTKAFTLALSQVMDQLNAVAYVRRERGYSVPDGPRVTQNTQVGVVNFEDIAPTVRTNLGLGASWLTNSASPATTNATNLVAGTLDDARLSTNVAILSNLPSWATTTNAATARTNLSLGTTNNVEFRTVKTLGTGSSNDIDIRLGQTGNGIWGSGAPNSVAVAVASNNVTTFYQTNTTFSVPIDFNNTTNAAVTRTNLGVTVASNLPAPYSGAVASNSLLTADGAGGSSFVANRLSVSGLTTNVVRTSWANVGADKTTNDTGLSLTYAAGGIYKLRWSVFVSSTWSNVAYGIAFSSTNSFGVRNGYQVTPSSSTPSGATIAAGVTNTTLVSDSTSSYPAPFFVGGEIVFFSTNSGTLNFRFWTTASNTNTSTLFSNSIISLEKMYP